jgi:hypothetical protein
VRPSDFWNMMNATGRLAPAAPRAKVLSALLMQKTPDRRTEMIASFREAMKELDTELVAQASGFIQDTEPFELARAYAVSSGRPAWERALQHPELLAGYELSDTEEILSVLVEVERTKGQSVEPPVDPNVPRKRLVGCSPLTDLHRNSTAIRNLVFQLSYFLKSNKGYLEWIGPILPESVWDISMVVEIQEAKEGAPGRLRTKMRKETFELEWVVSHRLMECDNVDERNAAFLDEVRDIFSAIEAKFQLSGPEFAQAFRLNPDFTVSTDPFPWLPGHQ